MVCKGRLPFFIYVFSDKAPQCGPRCFVLSGGMLRITIISLATWSSLCTTAIVSPFTAFHISFLLQTASSRLLVPAHAHPSCLYAFTHWPELWEILLCSLICCSQRYDTWPCPSLISIARLLITLDEHTMTTCSGHGLRYKKVSVPYHRCHNPAVRQKTRTSSDLTCSHKLSSPGISCCQHTRFNGVISQRHADRTSEAVVYLAARTVCPELTLTPAPTTTTQHQHDLW